MALLPPIKRFTMDDFASQKSWIGALFYPLNLFLNATYSALNNGLTVNQNTIGLVKVIPGVQLSGTTTLSGKTTINWPYFQSPPVGVIAMQNILVGTGGGPVVCPSIVWGYSSGVITINLSNQPNPTGSSQTTQSYNITFWVCGG